MLKPISAIIFICCLACNAPTAIAGTSILRLNDVNIRLTMPDSGMAASHHQIEAWVRRSAHAVADYYDGFPIPDVEIRMRAVGGNNIGGTAYGYDRHITLRLGRRANAQDLEDDWVLVHEMLHMGHPNVPNRHKWFKEGLATYVEPVAQARAGDMQAKQVWTDFVRQLPQGQPRFGDRGLDRTPTWGRVYWGGALFFLLADVGIREATDNQMGLEHALRAIVASGGTLDTYWPIERALAIGDKAVGVPVLSNLYAEMRDTPQKVDLESLWQQLGVDRGVLGVTLDDDAPNAHIRLAITGG